MKKTFLSTIAIICLAWSTSEGSTYPELTTLTTQRLPHDRTLVTLRSHTYTELAIADYDFSKADKITSMTCRDPSTNTDYTSNQVSWLTHTDSKQSNMPIQREGISAHFILENTSLLKKLLTACQKDTSSKCTTSNAKLNCTLTAETHAQKYTTNLSLTANSGSEGSGYGYFLTFNADWKQNS